MTRLPKGARAVGRTALLAEPGITATARAGKRDGSKWRCHRCGETFTAYAPCERHVGEEHGGGRIECLIEVVAS